MTMMQHRQIRYIGLDVHKVSITVAIAEASGAPSSYGSIANDPSAIRKLMTRLGGPEASCAWPKRLDRRVTRCTANSQDGD